MGVKSLFERGVRLFPRRILADDGLDRLTYSEAAARVGRQAAALHAEGIGPGAHCAFISPNSTAGLLAMLTVHAADAVFIPLSSALTVTEHAAVIGELEVCCLLYHRRHADMAEALRADHPALRLVAIEGPAGLDTSFDELIERHEGAAPLARVPLRTDTVAIYPTGGSTGRPKRVAHDRLVWDTMAACYLTAIAHPEDATFLMVPPITHAAGTYAMMMLGVGATIVIHDGFDPAAVLAAIEVHKVTHLFLPPTAIYRLIEEPSVAERDYASLRAFIYTAAPMSVEKLKTCISLFGPVMTQFWGQTEAPCFCTCLTPAEHDLDDPDALRRLASCGRETLLVQVEVMDEAGQLLPPGEHGELVVRSNLVMTGYYGNPEATEAASRFGWHHSGDVGFKDDAGYVFIVGRKSDMIISGGYNIYPGDIEQALWGHPAVEECAVIGIPDAHWGEAVMAVVQLRHGSDVDPSALRAYCRERLGGVRTPKRVEICADIPRNAVGKIDKPALRVLYASSAG